MAKKADGKGPFDGSHDDRRVSGVADRRVNVADYHYQEFPKAVYHTASQQARTVHSDEELKALGPDWVYELPADGDDRAAAEARILKGDGVNPLAGVTKVQVVDKDGLPEGAADGAARLVHDNKAAEKASQPKPARTSAKKSAKKK